MTELTQTTTVELDSKDLPAYCPNPAMPIWSSHPRVFLDFTANGEAKCPYCSTVYKQIGRASCRERVSFLV